MHSTTPERFEKHLPAPGGTRLGGHQGVFRSPAKRRPARTVRPVIGFPSKNTAAVRSACPSFNVMKTTLAILLPITLCCGDLHAAEAAPIQAAEAERGSTRPELVITTLGFGSCARQERPQPIWDAINAARCDAFVLCGDNIYADTSDAAVFRGKYALLDSMPGFAKLRQTTPLFATWDDHDYGLNDGGAGFPGAAAAQREFCDFFQVPADSPLRSSPGVYDCVTFGPAGKRVQLILLDTRFFRSPLKKDPANPKINAPNTDEGATILGREQWAWLERRLREPAEIRVVVSSIVFIPTEHGSEKWANFPQERARFLELLHRTRANGVVVISGDRHLAEISLLKPADGAPYPLYDLTTSGLNQPVAKESEYGSENPPKGPPNRYRIHDRPYTGSNFGIMRIDWNDPQPSVSLEIRGLGGEVVISHDVASESISGQSP
jgi:alkaline phosphatase D